MPNNLTLKNLPQYRHGTNGEANFNALLKDNLEPQKDLIEQLTLAYRISDYLTANVGDNFKTDIWRLHEKHQYVLRCREDMAVILAIHGLPLKSPAEQTVIEYREIPALNVTPPTIKRICEENGFVFTDYTPYDNVDTYTFEFKNPKGFSTAVTVSVEKAPTKAK